MTDKSPALTDAELKKAQADATAANLDILLKSEELKAKKEERRHKKWLNRNSRFTEAYNDASDEFSFNIVGFTGSVTQASVYGAKQRLRTLAALKPGEPIRFEINSPGGSVIDGFDLFDEVRRVAADIAAQQPDDDRRPAVTTVISGFAASMGGILAQAGDHRVIGRNAYLHLHEVATGMIGKASDFKDEADLIDRMTQRAAEIYAERATGAGKPTTADQVRKMFDRRELWLDAHKALELGFVDEVA